MSARPATSVVTVLVVAGLVSPIAACRGPGKYAEERNVTMKTAATPEEQAAGMRVKFDNALLQRIDDAIVRLKEDETADVSAATTDIVAMIEKLPESMNGKEILAQGNVISGRMDQVISFTRTPERRAPLGQLKKEMHQAFERAAQEASKPR